MPTKTAPKTFDTHIELKANIRAQEIEILNQQLADTFDLYSQTKQAHWNVKGIHFYQLHKLFDELAASVEPFVDVIAERVTSLGGVALGTARMAAANSTLAEFPAEAAQGEEHLKLLVDRYAAYAASSRAASRRAAELDDPTTEDMYIEITRVVDKDLYFLESHLQGK